MNRHDKRLIAARRNARRFSKGCLCTCMTSAERKKVRDRSYRMERAIERYDKEVIRPRFHPMTMTELSALIQERGAENL